MVASDVRSLLVEDGATLRPHLRGLCGSTVRKKIHKACSSENLRCTLCFPPQHRNSTCTALCLPARALHQIPYVHMEARAGKDLSEPPLTNPKAKHLLC